uniref:Uncharacterized protein n=1 Tax=Physcomitrium patens TaxID=3218 RepID=A0A2K1JXA7_PHYPA|nr:hypothetical protein PHYPA_013294 [Physcomitrium patens]
MSNHDSISTSCTGHVAENEVARSCTLLTRYLLFIVLDIIYASVYSALVIGMLMCFSRISAHDFRYNRYNFYNRRDSFHEVFFCFDRMFCVNIITDL